MNTDQNNINKNFSSALWIIIIVLLSVSTLILSSYYVYMMMDSVNGNNNDELKYKLWDASPTEYRFNTVRESSVTPSFIYFQNGSDGAALLNNESLTKEYFNDLKRYITEGFSDASFEIYQKDERTVIENAILSSTCICLKFPSELPFYIFLYYMNGKIPENMVNNEYYLYYVDSFFIVRQNNGEGYYIAAVSDDVIITSGSKTDILFPRELTESVLSEASLQGNTEFVDASFTRNESNESSAPFAVSINEDIYVSHIVASEKYDITSSGDEIDSVLTLFGYNPDKVSTYKESRDVDVFVETFGLLKFSDDSIVFEASQGDGIDLGEYTMIQGDVSLFDIICVCDGFISSISNISEEFIGGDAVPKLYSITYNNDSLVVSYKYFFDNIPIENADAAEFTFTNGVMTRVELYTITIENSLTRDILTGSGLIYKLYGEDNKIKSSYLDLMYRKNGDDLSAEWIIYK